MKYIVGIDIGTSSCKTVLVDLHGTVVSSAVKEYATRVEGTNAFQHPDIWFLALCDTVQSACGNGISPRDIVAVGCTGQAQTTTFLDESGRVLRDSPLWFGMGAIEITEAAAEKHRKLFRRYCHMDLSTQRTLGKIIWLKENDPGNWKKTDKILFTSAYIVYRLTGELIADTFNLTSSCMNDVHTNQWSDEILNLFEIEKERVPYPAVNPNTVVGKITKSAAEETGLPQGIPVIAGCSDVASECYSVNISGNQLKLRLGSAGAANAVFDKAKFTGDTSVCTPYLTDDKYLMGRYTTACARSVKWVRDMFFPHLPRNDYAYSLMDREAINSPLGASGMVFHPFLNGEDSPYYNSKLRGKIVGINLDHTRGDILRAVYEGVSYSLRDMLMSEPNFQSIKEIIYVGGGTRSRVWMPILANILGMNGVIPIYSDAAYGVALQAATGAGIFDGYIAADKSKKNGIVMSFEPMKHKIYEEHFQRYKQLALIEKGILW